MNRFSLYLLSFALAVTPLRALAIEVTPMPEGSRWYYEIGGAKPLSLPPTNQLVFGAEASFGHGLGDTCRKFDPAAALKAAFRGTLEQLEVFAVGTASNALVGLPLYLLAQADPQLYDLLKDGLWKADALFRLSAKTCEEMMRDIGEGRNPYEDFVILSRAKDVQLRANSGLDDLNTAIREANGDQGLPWVNGEWRGGRNAPPINIISDTAVAGYNVLVGRNPADLGGIGGEASTQPLVAIWPSAADCANWITDVLGDESVRTYDAGARSSRPGRGILPKHDEIVTEVRAAFEAILPFETPLSAEQLSTVSAPGIQITLDLIKRLRRLPKAEAAIAAARLAEEVAMARTIEQGLYAKRVLLSGRREPNIANSPARDEIDRAIL